MDPVSNQSIHRVAQANPQAPTRVTPAQAEVSAARPERMDTVEISAEAKALLAQEQQATGES